MFTLIKLTSKRNPQFALLCLGLLSSEKPFHWETLWFPLLSLVTKEGGCIPFLKSNKSSLLFRVLNCIKYHSSFCLGQEIKKQPTCLLSLLCLISKCLLHFFCILTEGFKAAGLPRPPMLILQDLKGEKNRREGARGRGAEGL